MQNYLKDNVVSIIALIFAAGVYLSEFHIFQYQSQAFGVIYKI